MEQIVKILPQQKQFSTDPEEYILTNDEENLVIGNAKKSFIERKSVRLKGMGLLPQQIAEKLMEYKLDEIFNAEKVTELLKIANSNKLQNIWHQDQQKKRDEQEKEKIIERVKRCNTNYFYRLMKKNSPKKLIENENTLPYLKTLCFFFGNDKRFGTELNFDFSKGLWIRGNAGIGKTYLLSCISDNELSQFEIHSMIEIAATVKNEGEYFIKDKFISIDDVGSEEATVNHYGTKINWFKEFIELYYAERKPFNNLIVTTNCSFDEIQDKYGFRVRSRVKDMFNIIDVKGEDLRGK